MRLYLAAAVVLAASGAAIRDHMKKAEAPAAPALPVMAAPERLHVVDVVRVESLPDVMSIGRVMESEKDAKGAEAGGGWVLPDASRKAPAAAKHRPPVRTGPQVSSATSVQYGGAQRYAIGTVGRIRGGLRVAMDRQTWRRSSVQNPFRDDSQYQSHRGR